MTNQIFKTVATEKLQNVSTAELIETVKTMSNDFSEGVDMVVDAILDILIVRLPETEFLTLCNSL